jgi:hypothetical protein
MNLTTINAVEVNEGIHGPGKTTHVKGVLYVEQIILTAGMDISIQYAYLDADNEDAILKSSTKIITEEEQTTLYNLVSSTLPDISANFGTWYKTLLYESFRNEMAETFGIEPSEININP